MSLMTAVITDDGRAADRQGSKNAKMGEQMMKHMMEQMQIGKESMSQCRMTKGWRVWTTNRQAPTKKIKGSRND